ncbi:AMP-binding protein [Nonomuraea fuscirosea]|uniref:AMP-binding protein n=1 Tax=Nonomuraea fuscirosea TaxID=1291556 RepID=UPI002DD964EB|nr:AMP-binding protein [Nonomuraea fuscirosea]WSA48398.1 AMP-binding protein [Nonomuraea fuscirosea]
MTGVAGRWMRHVQTHPGDVAIHGRSRVATYHDLATRASGHLAELDAVPGGDPVLIVCADPVETVAAMLAAMACGRVFAPVDVRTPPARLAMAIDDLRPGAVVVDRSGSPVLAATGREGFRTLDARDVRDHAVDPARWHRGEPDGPGYVYFTSGTTGRPKGVVGSLPAITHFVTWEIDLLGAGRGTRVSSLTSAGFDAFLRDAFVPLCSGGTMVVAPRSARGGQGLARWLESNRVQILHCVPTVFRTLRAAGLTSGSLPELRAVLLAGEPVRPSDVRSWQELFGTEKELINLYGPTETTMTKLFHRMTAADATADAVPVGRPLPGVAVRLLESGEVELRTPFPLHGYLGERQGGFDPSDPHRFRTGDLGRFRPDGSLELLGRRDRQVKVNGVRVELDDVANVLMRCPGVHDAHVVLTGEKLCAYVVAEDGRHEQRVLRHLREQLPPGVIPAVFVWLDELPRTLSGKVDRPRLPQPPDKPRGRERADAF